MRYSADHVIDDHCHGPSGLVGASGGRPGRRAVDEVAAQRLLAQERARRWRPVLAAGVAVVPASHPAVVFGPRGRRGVLPGPGRRRTGAAGQQLAPRLRGLGGGPDEPPLREELQRAPGGREAGPGRVLVEKTSRPAAHRCVMRDKRSLSARAPSSLWGGRRLAALPLEVHSKLISAQSPLLRNTSESNRTQSSVTECSLLSRRTVGGILHTHYDPWGLTLVQAEYYTFVALFGVVGTKGKLLLFFLL